MDAANDVLCILNDTNDVYQQVSHSIEMALFIIILIWPLLARQ